jgi:uncharacterized protein YkwD
MQHFVSRAIFVTTIFALAACAPKEEAPPPPAPPAPPMTLSERERAAANVHADPVAAAQMISAYRQAHGLSAVAPDPQLQTLAQAQADAMAQKNLLSHEVSGTLTQRFDAVHLIKETAIENVSAGYFTLDEAVQGWRNSPGHNENLLKPGMKKLGIAAAYAPGTRYLTFWALDMSN